MNIRKVYTLAVRMQPLNLLFDLTARPHPTSNSNDSRVTVTNCTIDRNQLGAVVVQAAAGSATSDGAPDHDADGALRPVDGDGMGGAGLDMGAYEFVPGAEPSPRFPSAGASLPPSSAPAAPPLPPPPAPACPPAAPA